MAVGPLRSCFFRKLRGFHRFHGCGNVQLVFKQNRTLWERAFLGALCTCNGLLFAISPLQFLFFLQRQKNKKQTKNNKLRLTPSPWGVQSCFSCCCFFFSFLGVLLSWFVVSVEGLAKKIAGSNSLPLFPP